MNYFFLFLLSLGLSASLVPWVKKLAFKTGAIDIPHSARKIHSRPTPLLGGLAIYFSFIISVCIYILLMRPDYSVIPLRFFLATFVGGLILMIGGFLDDKYRLPPKYQIIFPILAALTVVLAGIGVGIKSITNPLGGNPIDLDFALLGISFPYIFIFLYVLGMTYTTKILDGLDGLSSGISFIAGLTLFFLSLAPINNQPITASVAIIFCGAVLGFLIYNFNPASIFIGEGGSEWLGFMLAVLSVILGGKIATAILVMGIPILDVAWAIIRRSWYRQGIAVGDKKHLHFRLLDIGFSQRQAVLVLYFIAAFFGFSALFLQSLGKLISLAVLILVMVGLAMLTVMMYKRKYEREI
jgi:UDP-GlcNAc:undecaprenyl-phosphate/decaprenyl-phosphate GlcNAc-1-phosphate transferase